MSIGQIIVLIAVVGASSCFATILGWGDYRAQQLVRRIRDRNQKEAAAASAMTLKKVDKSETAASATAQARRPQPSSDRLQHVA